MSLAEHYLQMARNNAWSNLRLYRACEALTAEELVAPRTSFFPSLLATLKHIWIVDEYYVDGLEEAGRGATIWEDAELHQELGPLWAAQRVVDLRLEAFCRAATEASLRKHITLQRRPGPKVDTVSDILAHLFVHQIHHRGQVHAMLAGTRVAPPQLDEWFLAADRPIAEGEIEASR